MTSLKRSKSGPYTARKAIPADVRDEYRRRYGQTWEVRFTAPAGTPNGEAKALFNDWLAEIESRIAAIRASARGEGQDLAPRQARALAGDWYGWFVGRHEDDPGHPETWGSQQEQLVDSIRLLAPDWFDQDRDAGQEDRWLRDPDVRVKARPVVADMAETSQFLASRGLVLSNEARDRFLDCVEDEYFAALRLLERRASGDYTPDPRPQRFEKFAPSLVPVAGETCWQLFERWIGAKKPGTSTVGRWRGVFLNLDAAFTGRAAASISVPEANDWKNGLIGGRRSARTVQDVWIVAARTVFSWAVDEHLLTENPFTKVKVSVPKKARHRETNAFTEEEARTILKAALSIVDTSKPFPAAKRWVPWLCAYTGARSGEITQLRGKDVIEKGGIHALHLTPEAGTVKTGEPRTVPLHEHLIAQGFLEYVRRKGQGPLFYEEDRRRVRATDDPSKPPRPRPVKTRERLAGWVRSIGVTDKELQPNHAWRGTFKLIAERCGMPERLSDAITGHKPLTVGRGYGRPTLADLAAALGRFLRYEVEL